MQDHHIASSEILYTTPCCPDVSYITNFQDSTYDKEMGESLVDIGDWLKEFIHGKRVKSYNIFGVI